MFRSRPEGGEVTPIPSPLPPRGESRKGWDGRASGLGLPAVAVAELTDGLYEPWPLGIALELLPQIADVHAEAFRTAGEASWAGAARCNR